MEAKMFKSICLLLLVISCQAFSQNEILDVDKMREDAKNGLKKSIKWYDIVDVKKTDATFELFYNIAGVKDDEYEVSLALVRDSDPNFRIVPKLVSGKIGIGSFAGKNNSIVWNYKKEIGKDLKGNDYRFDLTVQKIEHGAFPWLWTGLGTVVAGGAAAVLLLGGKGSGAATPQTPVTTIPAIGISRPN